MPNTPTTSFIPKQGPVKRNKQTATRQVHVLAVIAYVAFVASLIAAVGLFLYEGYIEKQLEREVNALSQEIKGFSDADMERVREFNGRLRQTEDRLEKGISIASVLASLEQATVKSASVEQLSLKKTEDSSLTLTAKLATNNFDSTLFQRGVYERNDVIDSVVISDLTLGVPTEEDSAASGITFTATLQVPTEAVPSVVGTLEAEDDIATTTTTVETTTSSTTETVSTNPKTI
jgi:hypothetical protein